MKLKKLEIVGFKSFRDKVILDFSPGISGIVGPNGCGKSNIADAIRWVMGEQRIKTLRGKKMDDVIFNGSEEAPAVGMAAVSMLLAADENKFPGNYADMNEVAITRRIFREGESEYEINKVPCRLLDVREFFMGTGIGARTYSLVEQNSVSSLVEARPEERRQFIEEAAGISKFKSRKEFALRKMEATQENILRLNDILREVKLQLNGLARQAKRAEQYKTIKQSTREAELAIALQTCFELNEEKNSREEQKKAVAAKSATLAARLDLLESSREELKAEVVEQEALIFSLQEKLYGTRNAISAREQASEYSRRKAADLAQRAAQDRAQIEELKRRKDAAADEMAQLAAALEEAQKALEELRMQTAAANQTLEELRRMDKSYRQTIEEKKIRYVDLASEKARIKNSLTGLVRHVEDIGKREAREIGEIAVNSRRAEELAGTLENIVSGLAAEESRLAGLLERRDEIVQTASDNRTLLATIDERITKLRDGYSTASTRLAALREFAENYDGCDAGVKSLLAGSRKPGAKPAFQGAVLGLVADQIRVPRQYEAAVEALLGEKLQYIVVADQNEGVQAIDYLKSARLGRGSFVPLELRPRLPRESLAGYDHLHGTVALIDLITIREDCRQVIDELLGDALLIPNLREGITLWRQNGFRGTFVTPEGDIISPNGILTGGSNSSPERSLLGNRREIAELEEEAALLAADLAGVQEKRRDTATLISGADEELLRLRSELHLVELRINGLRKDRERYASETANVGERLKALAFNRESLAGEALAAQKAIASHQAELEKVERAEAELRESVATEREKAESIRDNLDEGERRLTEKKVRLAAGEEKCLADARALARLESAGSENDREIASRLADAEKCEHEAQQLSLEAETEKGALLALYGENERIAAELTRRRDAGQAKETLLRARETEIQGEKKILDGQLREQTNLETSLLEVGMQLDNLRNNILEKHSLDIFPLLTDFKPLDKRATAEAAARLQRDRAALENFGEVNLLALTEHEELKERFDFLTAQINDLNSSLDTLRRTISRINTITRQRFAETFEGINRCFQDVFTRLFPGGRAALKLTDENDLLETGVDIEIRIPGKFTRNVTLLSGGEKSLAAIALIFSILIYRPVPFILLDEADAALDDTNISLFNRLVKDAAANSQILMITHNKKSMEIADSLYGVTVRKKGISTLVSVSLS